MFIPHVFLNRISDEVEIILPTSSSPWEKVSLGLLDGSISHGICLFDVSGSISRDLWVLTESKNC